MTRPAEVQVARRDGWLSNDRIRLTGLLRKGPALAGPFYVGRHLARLRLRDGGRPDRSYRSGCGRLIAYAVRRLATIVAVVILAVAGSWVILGSLWGSIYGHVTVWHQLARLPGQLVRVFGHMDLGYDEIYRQPVSHSLWQGLPVDAALMLGGLVCGIVIGLAFGLFGGPKAKTPADSSLLFGSSVLLSLPVYLMAAVVIATFSNVTGSHRLGFVSGPGDYKAITHDPIGWLQSMWVPWLIVGAPLAAITYRMTRAAVRTDLEADFVRTARAKGVRERLVMRRHVLRAALPAVLGTVSVTVPTVAVNTILLESAMELPGLFTRFDISPQVGDKFTTPSFAVIQALVLETSALVAIGIFICDLLHAWLDPQIRR
jgi:peptide/nickel transport system permease protein